MLTLSRLAAADLAHAGRNSDRAGELGRDCNGNGSVSISELIQIVNIALGNRALATCHAGDVNGDGNVSISELIIAVGRALRGC